MAWNAAARRSRLTTRNPVGGGTYSTVAGVQGAEDELIRREDAYGERGTEAYLDRAENFDASAALDRYAGGAWNSVQAGLRRSLADVRSNAVGAGRFDSGFLDEDQGTVMTDAVSGFQNRLMEASMGALSAQQRNTESLGAFGSERSGRAGEMLSARSEQVQNDAREEAARRRRNNSSLLSGLGTLAGTAIGGPLGGAAGGAIGGWLGNR
jgi:hypothetical protein